MVDLCDKVSESEVVNNSSSQPPTPERVSSDGCTHPKTCADCGTTKTPLWRGGPAGPKSLCNACGIRSRKRRRAMLGLSNKEDKKAKKSTTSSSSKSSNNGQQNQQQNNDNNNAASSSSNNSSSSGDNSSNSNSNSKSKSKSRLVDISMKRKLLTFGRDVALQRPRSSSTIQRRKLGEVEQAAFLLMALSCGSVYA